MRSAFSGGSRRHRHSTPAERVEWVRRFHRSGLTQRVFASRHNLGLSSLRNWIARDRGTAAAASKSPAFWQEVTLTPAADTAPWAAELVWPDGLRLRVSRDCVVDLLTALGRVATC